MDVLERFRGRILGIDAHTANVRGTLLRRYHQEINVRRILDIWLAAIALHHDLTIVTRNERNFQGLAVSVLNPWTMGAGS